MTPTPLCLQEFRSSPVDFSLIIPCYREEEFLAKNVESLVALLKTASFSFELLFVEDASPDSTLQELRKLIPLLESHQVPHAIFAHPVNRGRGAAVKTGIAHARGKISGFIDIDLENQPEGIFPLYTLVKEGTFDVMVGRRVCLGPDLRPLRRFTHLGYRWLCSMVLDLPVSDSETGLKVFRTDVALQLLPFTPNDHWFWDTEILLAAQDSGWNVGDYPVIFHRKPEKKSTVRVFHDSLAYLSALWRYRQTQQARVLAAKMNLLPGKSGGSLP